MRLYLLFLIPLSLVVAACNISPVSTVAQPAVTADKPEIVFFTANTSNITSSQEALITWQVKNANLISVDQGIGPVSSTGTMPVRPLTTTSYILKAINQYGTSTSHVTIEVVTSPVQSLDQPGILPPISGWNPPVIHSFTATPGAGAGFTKYRWNVSGAKYVTIYPDVGDVPENGSCDKPLMPRMLVATAFDNSKSRKSPYVIENSQPEQKGNSNYQGIFRGIAGGSYLQYDFVDGAQYSMWTNGSELVNYAVETNNINGFVNSIDGKRLEDGNTYTNVLHTYPAQVSGGSIFGYFIEITRNKKSVLGHASFFSAKIGFNNKDLNQQARFRVIMRLKDNLPVTLIDVVKKCDGKLLDIKVYTADQAREIYEKSPTIDQDIYFRVDNIGECNKASAVWVDPKVMWYN